jgi:thioredoxin family protein
LTAHWSIPAGLHRGSTRLPVEGQLPSFDSAAGWLNSQVRLDGRPLDEANGTDVDGQGQGTVVEPRLYQLIRQQGPVTEHTFEITFLDPGAEAYAFTFG